MSLLSNKMHACMIALKVFGSVICNIDEASAITTDETSIKESGLQNSKILKPLAEETSESDENPQLVQNDHLAEMTDDDSDEHEKDDDDDEKDKHDDEKKNDGMESNEKDEASESGTSQNTNEEKENEKSEHEEIIALLSHDLEKKLCSAGS